MATQTIPMDWTAYYNSIKAQNPSASAATRTAAQTALGGSAAPAVPDSGISNYMGAVMRGNATQDPMMAGYTAQQFQQGRSLGNSNYAPVTPPSGWSSTGQYTAPPPPPALPQIPSTPPPGPGQPGYGGGAPPPAGGGASPMPSGASVQGGVAGPGSSAGDSNNAATLAQWQQFQSQYNPGGAPGPGQPGGPPTAAGPYGAPPPAGLTPAQQTIWNTGPSGYPVQGGATSGGGGGGTSQYGPFPQVSGSGGGGATGSPGAMNSAQQAYQAAQDAYNAETDPTKKAALQTQLTTARNNYQNALNSYNVQAQSGGAPAAGGGTGGGGGTTPAAGGPPQYQSPAAGSSVSGYPSIPGGYQTPAISPPGTGGDSNLAQSLESDRELAVAGGQQLQNQFKQNAGTAAGQANYFQGQLANAYAPLLAGQGGYTPAQIAAIQAQGGQFGLSSLDPNSYVSNLQGNASNLNAAVGGEAGAVNQALDQGGQAVQAAINPAELKWTPEMSQSLRNAAAQTSAAQTQATVQDINNRAFAAGNVSPAAIAAMQDRARQTGQINAAGAMTQAELQANQAKLGASQTYANLASQNAQETAQRNTGAQLQVGAQNVGAQQYLTGAGQGAVGAQQNELMNANQLESGRATTTANANLQAGQEARNNYLGTQSQQANQNMQVAGQQQLGAYNSTVGGTNQAGQVQVGNKATNQQNPGTVTNILGFAKGEILSGPRKALVGEKGLEAIVPLGPPKTAPQPHLFHMPRFQTAKNPNYGISPASLGRTMTRSGFQRILPQFAQGGEIIPMEEGGGAGDYNPADFEGLNDKTQGYGPNPWQRAAAIAGALAAGRMFPGLAGKLAGYGMSDDPNASLTGRDLAGSAVGDVAGRRNPIAGQLAQQAISKPVAPPANPAGDAASAAGKTTYANIMHNPTPPEPKGDIILSGGGAKRQIPFPRATGTLTPSVGPVQQTTPTPIPRPIDGGQTHDAPSPGVVGGPPPGNTPLPPIAPYPSPTPVPAPPVNEPPGTSTTKITFPPAAGGTGQPIPLPRGTGPMPMPGGADTGGSSGTGETPPIGVDYGTGPNQPPNPAYDTTQPAPFPTDPVLPPPGADNTVIAQPGSTTNPYAPFPTDPTLPPWDQGGTGPGAPGVNGGNGADNGISNTGGYETGGYGNYGQPSAGAQPGGGGNEIPPWGYTGPPPPDFSGGTGNVAPVNPPADVIETARGGLFAPKPSRAGRTPQGVRHKVSTGRPKKGDMSPAAAEKSAMVPPPSVGMMPEMAPPASPVSMMVPPVGQDQPQGYAGGGVFKPFPGYHLGGVIGYAAGGVVTPDEQQLLQSPYGPTEFVDGPQIRTLGQTQPEAVVPLTPRKGNKVSPEMVPHLIQRYASYQAQR